MSNVVGTIKIGEDRIITTKGNSVDTWTRFGNGDEGKFIVYNGVRYKLLKSKETESEEVEEEDTNDQCFSISHFSIMTGKYDMLINLDI